MNNYPWPYMPPQAPQQVPPFIKPNNLEEEIIKLKNDVRILKERVSALEKKEKNEYLKKEDGMYMI